MFRFTRLLESQINMGLNVLSQTNQPTVQTLSSRYTSVALVTQQPTGGPLTDFVVVKNSTYAPTVRTNNSDSNSSLGDGEDIVGKIHMSGAVAEPVVEFTDSCTIFQSYSPFFVVATTKSVLFDYWEQMNANYVVNSIVMLVTRRTPPTSELKLNISLEFWLFQVSHFVSSKNTERKLKGYFVLF